MNTLSVEQLGFLGQAYVMTGKEKVASEKIGALIKEAKGLYSIFGSYRDVNVLQHRFDQPSDSLMIELSTLLESPKKERIINELLELAMSIQAWQDAKLGTNKIADRIIDKLKWLQSLIAESPLTLEKKVVEEKPVYIEKEKVVTVEKPVEKPAKFPTALVIGGLAALGAIFYFFGRKK